MPRYRVEARFGPWARGDVFESVDPRHETLADNGLLRRLDESGIQAEEGAGSHTTQDDESGVPPSLTGVVQPQFPWSTV